MLDMIPLECHGIRHPDGQIGYHGQQLVGQDLFERQVMRNLVDGEKDVLVARPPDGVCAKEELERQRVGVPEGEGGGELDGEDEEDERRGGLGVTHQLADLGVSLEDGFPAGTMRLLGHDP